MKVAFLDRDGTLIKDYEDEKWKEVEEPEFLKGTIEGLKEITQKGYEIIIVTNQYLINEKIITLDHYKKINKKFLDYLKKNNIDILDVFFCPHSKEEKCDCFKPKPGLIKQALEKYNNIDLASSFIVGDSKSDIRLGKHFNLLIFGINIDSEDSIKVKSLEEVVEYI